ncbi:MAG: NUDIX hydrolase [Gammaproteobacteria bacterium]|nr:NUDIX hydrolase [Gammaproteobacteria bacterium]
MKSRWKPNVTVAAVVEQDGRFLIVEENPQGITVFNQPAGHLEPDEALVDAVCREVWEETGWEILPTHLVGIYQYEPPEGGQYLRFAFAAEAVRRHDTALDPAIVAVHWLTRDELLVRQARLRSPMVTACIDDYLAGHALPLNALHYLLATAQPDA